MAEPRGRRFRFSDAVYAIRSTPKSLRKWLQNPDLTLAMNPAKWGWRHFSLFDLLVLGVMRRLVDFGVPVTDANAFAHAALMTRLAAFEDGDLDADRLDAFDGTSLIVMRTGEAGDREWLIRLAFADQAEPVPSDAHLHVDVGAIVRTVAIRAGEILEAAELDCAERIQAVRMRAARNA